MDKSKIEEATDIADSYFTAGYTCSQSSLQGIQAALGIEDDQIWKLATGFGGGFGRQQLVCGALSGGCIACGAYLAQQKGYGREERSQLRADTYPMVAELIKRFEAKFGCTDCATLTGMDFSQPGVYERFSQGGRKEEVCHPAVRFVVETVAELADK